jgi:hypothetical protein
VPTGYVITPREIQPIRSANDTPEFRENYEAAEYVNALYALDNGYRGQGVTVAVIDTGYVNQNGEMDGRISPLSKSFAIEVRDGVTSNPTALGNDKSSHGTMVTNVLAAAANGNVSMGFAPEATIAVLRASSDNYDTNTFGLGNIAGALNYATSQKFKIVNGSFSVWGGVKPYEDALTAFAATGGLFVNSAGNQGEANPSNAPWITDANKKAALVVGALAVVMDRYELDSYSNKAGTLKDRYVVAPGTVITTAVDGSTVITSGTSVATPIVSALAATILSKWPQLTGQQAGDIIITTAKDIGDPGVDEVFGNGLVDFKAALSPVNPTLSNGATSASVQGSYQLMPAAMGTESVRSALANVTALDAFGRDYSGDLSSLVVRPETKGGHWLRRRLAQNGNTSDMRLGRFAGSFGFATGRYSFGDNRRQIVPMAGNVSLLAGRTRLRAGWNAQDSLQSDIMGLAPFADGTLAYAPYSSTSIGLDRYMANGSKVSVTVSAGTVDSGVSSARAQTLAFGWSRDSTDLRVAYVNETGSIMGMPGSGAVALGRGATTLFFEAHRTFNITKGWSVEGYGSLGLTRIKHSPESIVTNATALIGSRLGIQANGPLLGGTMSFGIAQPLMVESGKARINVASGYDLESQSLLYTMTDANLRGQRRLQVTTGFEKRDDTVTLRFGAMRDLQNRNTVGLLGVAHSF